MNMYSQRPHCCFSFLTGLCFKEVKSFVPFPRRDSKRKNTLTMSPWFDELDVLPDPPIPTHPATPLTQTPTADSQRCTCKVLTTLFLLFFRYLEFKPVLTVVVYLKTAPSFFCNVKKKILECKLLHIIDQCCKWFVTKCYKVSHKV